MESSSLIWICSSSEMLKPFVTILDVNCPNSILEGFNINEIGARIFCIASVSGKFIFNLIMTKYFVVSQQSRLDLHLTF